jgi:hypothetical protein
MVAVGSGTNTAALSQVAYTVFNGLGTPIFPTSPNDLACAYGAGGMFVFGGNSTGTVTTVGNTTVFGQVGNDLGIVVASRYVVGTTGTLVNMSINIQTAAGNVIMGVYTDTGLGYPGTMLATTASTAIGGTGWMTMTPTSSNVAISSYAVWIVHAFSSSSVRVALSTTGGSTVSYAYAYGTLPLTWPASDAGINTTIYSQYLTINTQSTLAYSYDGLNFYDVAANPFTGTVDAIAYSPALGIWVAGGSGGAQIGYSWSGTSWSNTTTSALGSVAGIGTYYTTLQSPSSLQGVMQISGTGPLAAAQNQLTFVFGGYNAAAINAGNGLAYTVDNVNVWNTGVGEGSSIKAGAVRAIAYAPEISTWLVTIATATTPTWTTYVSTSPLTEYGTATNSPTAATVLIWSSTFQYFISLNNATSNICWVSNSGLSWSLCAALGYNFGAAGWTGTCSRQQGQCMLGYTASGAHQLAYGAPTGGWTAYGSVYFTSHVNTICWAPSIPLWIIGGDNATGSITIMIVSDPALYVPYPSAGQPFGTSGGSCNGCAYGNGVIVCVGTPGTGSTNTIVASTDGNNWSGLGNSVFSTQGNAVAYSYTSQVWMAVGAGTNTVGRSYSGTSGWVGISSTAFTSADGGGVAIQAVSTPLTTGTRDAHEDEVYYKRHNATLLVTTYRRRFSHHALG